MSTRTRPCPTGKIAYPSPGAAAEAIRAIRARRTSKAHRPETRHYRCDQCHLWHLATDHVKARRRAG